MQRKQFLLAAAVCLLAVTPAMAKTDFSGTWKIVLDKSDFGPMPAPEKVEQVVEQKDSDIKVNLTQVGQQGEIKFELNYSTEKETTNTFRNAPMKSTAKWDGDKLVVVSKIEFQGNEIVIQDTWSLADEGKTLTMDRKLNTPQGDIEMKQVFSKQ
ncbi:MAG: hypothetical protein JNK48_17650 [Bryobacterales bacterium]|nr:hypothetical protein [Bryobacterales bacterium]